MNDSTRTGSRTPCRRAATAPWPRLLALALAAMLGSMLSSAHAFKLESDTVVLNNTLSNPTFTSVSFRQSYDTPPVVVPLATESGGQPSALRIRNVTTSGFEIAQTEAASLDGGHASMTIDYVAVEPGVHAFPDGTVLEAGTVSTAETQAGFGPPTGAWEAVALSGAFTSTPAVVAHLQSMANERGNPPGDASVPFLATAIRDVATTGFDTAIERSESPDGPVSSAETIGYLAIAGGAMGTFDDNAGNPVDYEGLITPNNIEGWDDGCFGNGFAGSYGSPPQVVAAMNTRSSDDGGWLRRCSLSASAIGLRVDEDVESDFERSHPPETAGAVVFSRAFDAELADAAEPLVEYRMEADAWDGTGGEVADDTGNLRNGTAEGDATTGGADPALPGNPGTCRYGEFDGDGDHVLDADAGSYLNGLSGITVTAWVRNTAATPTDGGIFTTGTPQGQDNFLGLRYDAQGASTGNSANLKASVNTDQCAAGEDCIQVETESGLQVRDDWQHVAMTWQSGDKIRIFIDGVEVQTTVVVGSGNLSGTLDDVDFLRLGQSTNGSGDWQGQMDEFRIYDQALSETRIGEVRAATHPCAVSSFGVLDYHMDESQWTGAADEVQDFSGNSLDGASRGAVTDDASRAIGGSVGTCGYGRFTGGDYVEGPNDAAVNDADSVSLSLWLRMDPGDQPGGFQTILAYGESTIDPEGRFELYRFNGFLFFEIRQGNGDIQNVAVFGDGGVFDGDWHHVAASFSRTDRELQLWVDGNPVGTNGFNGNPNLNSTSGPLAIGARPGGGNSIVGDLDEVRIYDQVLTNSEVSDAFARTRPCGAALARFVLSHDRAGINCRAEDVVLRAEDASGAPLTGYTGSVDLSTTTVNGDWAIGNGNGSLSGGGGDDGSATYTFAGGDNGEVTLEFSNTHAETLNIDATDGTASDDDTEGDITFRPWGFEFAPDPMPTQIAGRPFDLTLTAVGKLPSDPGCNVIEAYDGDRDLKFWFDYEDPGSGSVDVTVDGTPIASSASGASDQTVAFSNGTATVAADYRDAGEIQLHARDDTGVGEPPSGSGDELVSGGAIGGGTNPFVVRPFGFYLDFDPDGDGTFDDRAANAGCAGQTSCAANAGGDVFATAGATFGLRIAAVVYQSADDDGSGRPVGNAVLADNAETPNFGREDTPETVDLARTLVAPSPGTPGGLANAAGVGGFSGGAREVTNLRYSEVGIIDLAASLSGGAYLGTVDVTGAAANVGRFIPADFVVSERDAGMYAATCNGAFSYIGQGFGYDARPRLDITARNANEATTVNYRGDFIRLTTGGVALSRATEDATALSNVGGDADVAVNPSAGGGDALADTDAGDAAGNGRLVYTLPDDDTYTYVKEHNARIAPFTADLPIGLDGVTDGDGVTEDTGDSIASFTPMGVQLRFGRLIIDDAYGPEVAPVQQRWRIETWRGDNWATEGADGCTGLTLAGDVQLDGAGGVSAGDTTVTLNDGSGDTEITSGAIGFAAGTATVAYDDSGAGNRGWIGVATALGTGHHLLVDDNDDGGNDGPYDVEPSARVTFGVFAGESENIYLREVFPAP